MIRCRLAANFCAAALGLAFAQELGGLSNTYGERQLHIRTYLDQIEDLLFPRRSQGAR